jgi:DNA-binding FrmR family transcriptional regulator
MKTMKEEIILKLKIVQSKIKKIRESLERNECEKDIIIQICKARKLLLAVRQMILKDYLIKLTQDAGFSKKEVLQYFDLMN